MASETISNFDSPTPPKKNLYVYACAILASMSSILLGYDIGVMSGASIYIQEDLRLTDVQIEVLAGVLNIYALIGSTAAGRTSDWIGRRLTIVLAGVIFFAGAILMGLAKDYAFLMFGRFIAGIGVGFAMMIAPVYTAEVAPASSRGFLTSLPEVFINIGILLGYVSNVAFQGLRLDLGWRVMLGIAAIPSIFLALGVMAMPESPRWLVMKGRLADARKVLEDTSDSKEQAQLRLESIKEAAGIPAHVQDDVVEVQKMEEDKGVWKELFLNPTPAVRHILIAGILLNFFQQISGIDAVVLYSPRIFEKAGITSAKDKLLCTVAVGFIKTMFILVATFLIDRAGRRPLLLSSVGGMVISLLGLGFGLVVIDQTDHKVTWAVALCILAVLAYVAFFSIGIGPMVWVYCSEIFPLRLRATGMSMGVAVNRVISGLISMTFISLYKAITIGGAFLLFAGFASIAWVFCFTCLPETRGRTLEETEGLFGHWDAWKSKPIEEEDKKNNADYE